MHVCSCHWSKYFHFNLLCSQGRNEQKGVVLGTVAGCKSNHHALEIFTGNTELVNDCKMSLSMNSKAPQSLLKPNKSADVNDVSLELTLA